MKKISLIISSMLILLLAGCSSSGNSVETLKGWSFQYNEGTKDYSLFFGLCDKNDNYLSADADVAVRIENENGDIVYEGTTSITEDDFSSYTSQVAGERYLANVRIAESEIQEGTSSSGTVYFTVSDGKSFAFDECNCSALYCLPVKDIQLSVESLPIELQQRGYDGSIESKILVTDVQFSVDNSLSSSCMTIVVSGEKTYGKDDGFYYDIVSYKLYDSEGYLSDSGQIYLGTSLSVGDKFKDDSLTIYDLMPGETYTLQLLDYGW